MTLLGGGFGRKSKPDYVAEAAVLSQKVGRPVKVVLDARGRRGSSTTTTRWRPVYMRATLDANGKPTAWLQRSVFPPITSIFDVNAVYGDLATCSRAGPTCPSIFPICASRMDAAKAHVRIGWLRSVANIYHAFAVQSFAG